MSVLFKDKLTGFWRRAASNLIYAAFPVGSIVAYGGSSDVAAPAGCMYCHGQVLNASDYPDLYDVIGTKFGVGDGSAGSFSLPDLQGQFLRGAGTNRDSTQGNGGTVGARQKATVHAALGRIDGSGNIRLFGGAYSSAGAEADKVNSYQSAEKFPSIVNTMTESNVSMYLSRPTNTSVEYIIRVIK